MLDDAGWIWVAQTPPGPRAENEAPPPTIFDIFDPEGRYFGAITVDGSTIPPPVIVGDRIVGVAHDALGVQRVVAYRLRGRPRQ